MSGIAIWIVSIKILNHDSLWIKWLRKSFLKATYDARKRSCVSIDEYRQLGLLVPIFDFQITSFPHNQLTQTHIHTLSGYTPITWLIAAILWSYHIDPVRYCILLIENAYPLGYSVWEVIWVDKTGNDFHLRDVLQKVKLLWWQEHAYNTSMHELKA